MKSSILDGFDVKTMFYVRMVFWITTVCGNFAQIPKLWEPLSKTKTKQLFTKLLWHHQWNYHIWRMQYLISKEIAPRWSWKNSHLRNSKKSILNFWPNWSISMCSVTFYTWMLSQGDYCEQLVLRHLGLLLRGPKLYTFGSSVLIISRTLW